MQLYQRMRGDLFWLLLLVCICGCNGRESQLTSDLMDVGIAYSNYQSAHKKGPPNWTELEKLTYDKGSVPRVREAGYEVKWGVEHTDHPDPNTVLAEKPGSNLKLMMNFKVQKNGTFQ